jgi:membrane protease YdiL (CAAX protease family)
VAEDIGLTLPSRSRAALGSELVCGPVGYALSLPFLLVGVIVSLPFLFACLGGDPLAGARALLAQAGGLEPKGMPIHPAVEILVEGDFSTRLAIFLLATVAAPVVEEIFFRGVLYRHLRSRTWRLGTVRSWIVSGLVSSVLFAVIHPQGLAVVPALSGLAIGFCLVREWRGSLLPGMLAHGINNGVALLLVSLFA